jgi:hypothetical protein
MEQLSFSRTLLPTIWALSDINVYLLVEDECPASRKSSTALGTKIPDSVGRGGNPYQQSGAPIRQFAAYATGTLDDDPET